MQPIFLVTWREPNTFPNDSLKFRACSTEGKATSFARRKLKGKPWRIRMLEVDPEDD